LFPTFSSVFDPVVFMKIKKAKLKKTIDTYRTGICIVLIFIEPAFVLFPKHLCDQTM